MLEQILGVAQPEIAVEIVEVDVLAPVGAGVTVLFFEEPELLRVGRARCQPFERERQAAPGVRAHPRRPLVRRNTWKTVMRPASGSADV